MSGCQKIQLRDRAVFSVSGADARKFLEGLVTNSIERAGDGLGIHAGLLAPQGKILFDFFIVGDGAGGYLIDCNADQKDELIKRLTLYKLRAKVEIADRPELLVAALIGEACELPGDAIAFHDPRLAALGDRALLTQDAFDALDCAAGERRDYDALRIELGVPAGGEDFAYGQSFPHDAMFDQLNGVDFRKGCFVGQEVVSRMQHRGTARKRIVPVVADAPLPEIGTEVGTPSGALGTLTSVSGTRGLAMLRLDRAGDALAKGEPVSAGDVPIRLVQPDWARFEVPSPAATA